MSVAAITCTSKGFELGQLLRTTFGSRLELSHCAENELFSWTKANFLKGNTLVYISSTETAVRAIAPFLHIKNQDAAVIVIDESGSYVLPLILENDTECLAASISKAIGATAILSTSYKSRNLFDIDAWASSAGLHIANPAYARRVSSKLFAGETVSYSSIFPITGAAPAGIKESLGDDNCDFIITYLSAVPENALHLVPPVLTLGVACTGTPSFAELDAAFYEFMHICGCHPLAVRELCTTTDSQTQNTALIDFCERHSLSMSCYTPKELLKTTGDFSAISLEDQLTGTNDTCERCAVLGSSGGTLFVRKTAIDDIVMALAIKEPNMAEE